jgi:hypothetical protein
MLVEGLREPDVSVGANLQRWRETMVDADAQIA